MGLAEPAVGRLWYTIHTDFGGKVNVLTILREGVLMQIAELLDSAQYVTDNEGKKNGVLLELEVWQELVQLLEQETAANGSAIPEKEEVEGTQREAAMLREEAAFRKLHPFLYKQYAGKYVAIYNEQLIDSDSDQVALYRRMRKQHPGQFIWIAPVKETLDKVLVFRSPRLLNDQL